MTAVWLALWFLSTPAGSTILSAPLARGWRQVASREEAAGARVVVVLGGGITSHTSDALAIDDVAASALRVIEGARVYRVLDAPSIVVSGGNTSRLDPPRPEAAAFRDALIRFGIPASTIVLEAESTTTREEAVILARTFKASGTTPFVLVTSPVHMPRAMAAFRAVGLDPIPSASRLRDQPDDTFWTPMPDRRSLEISDAATYEYVAWIYYWLRGWVRR